MERHIVASYDAELQSLQDIIARMGGMAESQLADALKAMQDRDSELAARVMKGDDQVDEYEQNVNELAVRLLALRSPVADDLRQVLTSLKVASGLERVADHAANAAKRSLVLNQSPPIAATRAIVRMGHLVQSLLKEAIDAYLVHDSERALEVWKRDQEVDDLHSSLFRELLTYMIEDPRNIGAGAHLMFIAKNIERIGDHATNIAELTHFLVSGRSLKEERPKKDTSSYAIAGEEPKGE